MSTDEAAFSARCEQAIREQAHAQLGDARATLERHADAGFEWFVLTPANPASAPVSVTPNGPGVGEITIEPGRNGAWLEAWGSPEETLAILRRTLDAVLAGRYEEFHKRRKHVGRLLLADGPLVFRGNTLARWPPRFGRWSHASYDRY